MADSQMVLGARGPSEGSLNERQEAVEEAIESKWRQNTKTKVGETQCWSE